MTCSTEECAYQYDGRTKDHRMTSSLT